MPKGVDPRTRPEVIEAGQQAYAAELARALAEGVSREEAERLAKQASLEARKALVAADLKWIKP